MANKDSLFRADIARGGDVRVIKEREVIAGFAVVTKGLTHDERGEFDDPALDAVVEFGNKSKLGIKSRFGHPNMSSTALGTFLGRAKNFRRDGDVVRADLHIDPTAHEAPGGDLAQYVMGLAESDSSAFGSSMVIYWDEEYRKDEKGQLMAGENGEPLPPLIRVKKLFAVDVVDDPAANNGFFEFFNESVKPSAEMTSFLNKFLESPEAVSKVAEFLKRYEFNKNKTEKEEVNTMMNELTLEMVKADRPDLFNAIRNEGIAEGVKKGADDGVKLERERAVSILKKSQAFKDMTGLAVEAVEKGMTFEQSVISFQDKQLAGLQKGSVDPVGPDAEEVKALKGASHFDRAKAHKAEHGCSMTEALKATAEKRK